MIPWDIATITFYESRGKLGSPGWLDKLNPQIGSGWAIVFMDPSLLYTLGFCALIGYSPQVSTGPLGLGHLDFLLLMKKHQEACSGD